MYKLNQAIKVLGILLVILFIGQILLSVSQNGLNPVVVLSNLNSERFHIFGYLVIGYIIFVIFVNVVNTLISSKKIKEIKKNSKDLIQENNLFISMMENDMELNQFELTKRAIELLFYFQDHISSQNYKQIRAISTKRFYDKLEDIFPLGFHYNFEHRIIKNAQLVAVDEDSNYIAATLEIALKELYYETDDINKVSDGNQDRRINHVFLVSLIKRKTYFENPQKTYPIGSCFNCGIPLVTNEDNTCIQCNANLSSGAYGFVLDSVQLIDFKNSQFYTRVNIPYVDQKKSLSKVLKNASVHEAHARKYVKSNFTKIINTFSKGNYNDNLDLMTEQCSRYFSDIVRDNKEKDFKLEIKNIVNWNVLLSDFYQLQGVNYYTYILDGKMKMSTVNEKGRVVLGDFGELQTFIVKIIVVNPVGTKDYKVDQYYSMRNKRLM